MQRAPEDADADDGFARIEGVYTHFNKIELIKDSNGDYWADRSWAKDIALHRRYIPRFRMCAPVRRGDAPGGWINLSADGPLKVFEQRPDSSWLAVLGNIAPNSTQALFAARGSDIVHFDGAGWAAPNTFILVLMSAFWEAKRVIVIESMFWRVDKGERVSMRRRIEHVLHDQFLRRAVRSADARIFTHAGYRDYFLPADAPALINPASWVDDCDIIALETLQTRHRARTPGPLRALFAARWTLEKGVATTIAAIDRLSAGRLPIEVTFMGDGPMAADIQAVAARDNGSVSVKIAPPALYGPAFFEAIGAYDVMLVPTLSSEQPRVIFDAFSQGVPVIASETQGNLSIIDAGSALTFQPGDAAALALQIGSAASGVKPLQEMGERALKRAAAATHQSMHRVRSQYLAERLARS